MKYAGKTVVGLAHERGANGHITKRDTAWQYLLSHIRIDAIPLAKRGGKDRAPHSTRAEWERKQWIRRIEVQGGILCHMHGYATRIEASQQLLADRQYIEDALLPEHISRRKYAAEQFAKLQMYAYDMQSLPITPQTWNDPDYALLIGGRLIRLHRSDSASWSGKYKAGRWPDSKSIARYAYLIREDAAHLTPHTLLTTDGSIEEKKITYEARGNWLLRVVVELLGIQPVPVRGKSHIQLDPHYRIALRRKIGNTEIWERTLSGDVYDYCAVRGKDTYHAATPREAVHGLAQKLAAPGTRREKIDMDYALSLGYCRSGVDQFCEDYQLDAEKSYTRAEIQALIVAGNGRAEKYQRELEKAGFVIS